MKKLIMSVLAVVGLTGSIHAQWCGAQGVYANNQFVRYNYYGGGGGCAYGNYGGWNNSSSFGNQYGQWGNGQGATLNGVAAIIGAAVPILAPRPMPQQMPAYQPVYTPPAPVIIYR
jgi:hypothetical protein